VIHTLLDWMGLTDASGKPYLFWSGFGADLSEFAIVGAVVGLLRRWNCESHGCWRIARHKTAAEHRVCRHHHPAGAPTAADISAAHAAAIDDIQLPRDNNGG